MSWTHACWKVRSWPIWAGALGAEPYLAQVPQFRELMHEKGQAVLDAFQDLCKQQDVTVESHLKSGHPAEVILEEEIKNELLVLGHKGIHAPWIDDMMGSTVERVVRSSIKPCLVTPSTFHPITKILIGYDGSQHASQALHEAIELANALDVSVVILTVEEQMEPHEAARISSDALKLARAHDCPATPLTKKGRSSDTLLQQARQHQCDLIVLGAYGHSRIREMILGSTTHDVITRTDLPVLLVR